MKNIVKVLSLVLIFGGISACTDLDIEPKDLATANNVFKDPSQYKAFLAKLYAGLAVSGQQGAAGQADIQGIDEGFSQYIRAYWKAQELTTDEAVTAWGDVGLADYHEQSWTAGNQFTTALYARIFFQIGLANEFLRETTDDVLEERGTSDVLKQEIQGFRAEARFLRALSYWHGLDMFRNIPFFTENDALGLPEQGTPQVVFDYIESELLDIADELPGPRLNQYGRADQAVVWMLLSKLYLNSMVYTGTDRATDALTYANNVIGSGSYALNPTYMNNFLADNHTSPEMIFPVTFDGLSTRSFGGMTFLTHMPVGGTMDAESFGIDGGWSGMRTTSFFTDLFPNPDGTTDGRSGLLWTDGQNKEIESISNFNDGYGVVKYRNVTSDGAPGSNATHPDTDFPMFRLADAYLIYAEAFLRNGGGDEATALGYINDLRERAYGNASGNISSAELTLDFILEERGRELFWECHRRTDLVRFSQFSENGVWPWKGNVAEGRTTPAFRNIFPIPAAEIIANPNLEQNDQY